MLTVVSSAWESILFGGTDSSSADDNSLRSLDLSFLFLAPPVQLQNSSLSALSSDLRYVRVPHDIFYMRNDMMDHRFRALFEQDAYKDVTFKLDDRTLRAHKCIIAARCPVRG